MSSRFGPRAVGTDGMDFKHRQRVAAHYQESVTFKFRLKALCILHVLILVLVYIKLTEEAFDWIQVDLGPVEKLQLPDAYLWEWWWALSAICIPLALLAMPKNRPQWMYWCYLSHFILGIMPLSAGLGTMTPDLWAHMFRSKEAAAKTTDLFLGSMPMVVLWFPFFVIAVQVHCFSMYCAAQLVRVWKKST